MELSWWKIVLVVIIIIAIHDVLQRKHTIRAIFPVVGWGRWICEAVGDKLYQYFIENRTEGKPFSKDQRAWVHASSKKELNSTGFGTKSDFNENGHFFIKPAMFPKKFDLQHTEVKLPCIKTIGAYNKRKKPYKPSSIVNISGMSYGALSPTAVTAMNQGAGIAGCYQTTGEGGLSPYHKSGADVVFQFGTGYNGCRGENGSVSIDKLAKLVEEHPFIKMIEIKLHQGAKPGAWSILPKSKMTDEIRQVRELTGKDEDSVSPGYHMAFDNVFALLALIDNIADKTGLPVGIKCSVGQEDQWWELARAMKTSNSGPDYIIIDGGEGGTGSAKASMVDHMGLPFTQAFSTVYRIFEHCDIQDRVVWVGSGKLGFPAEAIKAMAMGCDMINVARTVMLSIGCIQSGLCHTDNCPSGVATQKKWRYSKLDPTLKSHRVANYIMEFRKNIMEMTAAAGYTHPSQFDSNDILINSGDSSQLISLTKIIGYHKMYNKQTTQYDTAI